MLCLVVQLALLPFLWIAKGTQKHRSSNTHSESVIFICEFQKTSSRFRMSEFHGVVSTPGLDEYEHKVYGLLCQCPPYFPIFNHVSSSKALQVSTFFLFLPIHAVSSYQVIEDVQQLFYTIHTQTRIFLPLLQRDLLSLFLQTLIEIDILKLFLTKLIFSCNQGSFASITNLNSFIYLFFTFFNLRN